MPLARRQVPSVSIFVHLPQEFWHQHRQRLSNQLRWFIAKNFCGGGICKDDCAALVHADHGVIGRFDHHAVSLLGLHQFVGPFYDALFEFLVEALDFSFSLLNRGGLDNDPTPVPPCEGKLVCATRIQDFVSSTGRKRIRTQHSQAEVADNLVDALLEFTKRDPIVLCDPASIPGTANAGATFTRQAGEFRKHSVWDSLTIKHATREEEG